MLDIKKDFPLLNKSFNGKEIVYLDSAATSQKPQQVLDAINQFYTEMNANVGRSSHFLADAAAQAYEDARTKVANFLGCSANEIIFTKNSTESLNMVALGLNTKLLGKNSTILATQIEHNSSLLPWKQVAQETSSSIEYLEVSLEGEIEPDWTRKLNNNVKVVLLTQVSNVLGVELPIKEICKEAKKVGAITIVDGSQAVGHISVNVKDLGCDFYAFSGHKMFGPMGIGVLYGKKEVLDQMIPMHFGGGSSKTLEELQPVPARLEAGTPNVAGAYALGVASDYINTLGIQNIEAHIAEITAYAYHKLSEIPNIKILGPQGPDKHLSLISFIIKDIHSHDIATILSEEGICVRSGMQCAMNFYQQLNLPSSTRASFHVYNNKEDVDKLVVGINKAIKILGKSS